MNADKSKAIQVIVPMFCATDSVLIHRSHLRLSAFICGQSFHLHHSFTPNFLPSHWAAITSTKSARMNITPSAESSTYWPFSHSSQITIETTSVPGL